MAQTRRLSAACNEQSIFADLSADGPETFRGERHGA